MLKELKFPTLAPGRHTVRLMSGSAAMAIGIAIACPVTAQTVESQQPGDEASESGGLVDIVVTAQRRTERLQDVPVAGYLIEDAARR